MEKSKELDDDVVFRETATLDGFSFHLVQQPPNSPDMNVLDLRFFRSIQNKGCKGRETSTLFGGTKGNYLRGTLLFGYKGESMYI